MARLSPALAFLFVIGLAVLVLESQAQNSPQDFVNAHNDARQKVNVPPLAWDDKVARYAQEYGNKLSGNCQLVHSGGPYGENLFGGSGRDWTAADAVSLWVDEKKNYDYNTNTCASGQVCGHYTQVVWRNSVRLGCARVQCQNGGVVITCNYDPPGNVQGEKPY